MSYVIIDVFHGSLNFMVLIFTHGSYVIIDVFHGSLNFMVLIFTHNVLCYYRCLSWFT